MNRAANPISLSSVLGSLCRLSGYAVTVLVLRVTLGGGLESSLLPALLQVVLAALVALLIGNVVKEWAFALTEGLVTAFGRPFVRKAVAIGGRTSTEIGFPDGTWIRHETWKGGAALEWTERDGSCTRIESPAMTMARAVPLQTGRG
jgi:hypothetical protein